MNPVRKQRLIIVIMIVAGAAIATAFITYALRQNMNVFYTPSQITAGEAKPGQTIRVGGLVVVGSVIKAKEGLGVSFDLTDNVSLVTVHFDGILPDLFREGQGILARGKLNVSNEVVALEVLAKHDENYMSPEVKAALEASGQYKGNKDEGAAYP